MEVVPSIDIKKGRCVQLVQGRPGTEQVVIEDPVGVAKKWVREGAPRLHIIDLDGAFLGVRKNTALIQEIIETVSVPVQVGGGIRTLRDAQELLWLGADRVILGTIVVQQPDFIARLAYRAASERVMAALDVKAGEVMVKGWTEGTGISPEVLAQKCERLGAGSLLYTNVHLEGRLRGVDAAGIQKLARRVKIPIYASGGIGTLKDIAEAARAGAAGAVVGLALYEDNFSLKDALEVAGRAESAD